MSEPATSDVVIDNLVWINPDRLGGVPCFFGTRVPIKNLFDYVSGAEGLEGFLEGYPSVKRDQAQEVLQRAEELLLANLIKAAA